MNTARKIFLSFLAALALFALAGCSADDPLTDKLFITDISGEDAEFESVTTDNAYIANLIATGDVSIGANKLKTTTHYLIEDDVNYIGLRKIADDSLIGLNVAHLAFMSNLVSTSAASTFRPPATNDTYICIQAMKNNVGATEIARLQGAADPYFAMGGSQQFKFYNSGTADFAGAATVSANVSWLPATDGTWSIGSDAKRLNLVRAVSVTSGDLGFEETTCHLCGKPFKVGDKICLIVVAVEDGSIKTVPICRDCFLKD